MSYQNRSVNPSLRHPSLRGSQASAGQSPMLVARINEKKAELESLKQLRDLSGGLAAQMQALEEKLSTLSDGTEAVAAVLSNWHNVLRAINMASLKMPKASPGEEDANAKSKHETEVPLPQTLVRIPVKEADLVQPQDSGDKGNEA